MQTEIAEAMAEMPKADIAEVLAILGAGPIVRSNHSLMVKFYAEQNGAGLKAQRKFIAKLKEVLSEYVQADNKLYDSQITSGYVNADWAEGIERLVKEGKGRKAGVKDDAADEC
jgi:uncharacterized Fe-S cluster-containing radical SAM superfamily protein